MSDLVVSAVSNDKLRSAMRAAWDEAMALSQVESQYVLRLAMFIPRLRGCCVSFPDSRLTPQDVPDTLLHIISLTLDDLVRQTHLRDLVERLPTELLAKIADPLEPADRVRMALVSKAWHAAVFSTPALWNRIVCWPSISSALAMVQMLRLSAQADLDMQVTLSAENRHIVLPALKDAIHRCTRLRVKTADDTYIQSLLELPAPRLRSLIIHDPRPERRRLVTEGKSFLGGQVQNLNLFSLVGEVEDMLPGESQALASVRAVSLSPVVVNIPKLEKFLTVLPALVYLRLHLRRRLQPTTSEDEGVLSLPASVQSLDIIGSFSATSSDDVLLLLKRFQWTHLIRARLFLGEVKAPEDLLLSFFHGWSNSPGGLRTAWIGWTEEPSAIDGGHGVGFGDGELGRPVLRTHRGPVSSVTQPERSLFGNLRQKLPNSLFANVTKLYLHELVFDKAAFPHGVPLFPQVIDLIILLMDGHFFRNELGLGPFLVRFSSQTSSSVILICSRAFKAPRMGVEG